MVMLSSLLLMVNLYLKGTRCLGLDELVFKKRLMKCTWLRDILKEEYNDRYKYNSKLHGFPFVAN